MEKAVVSWSHAAHTHTHVVRTAPVRSVKSVLKTAAGGTKGGDAGKWHLLSPRWPCLTHGWQPHQADLLIKRSLVLSLSFSLSPPFTPATWSCVKGLRKARLGTNIVRDRDIAGGCGMECDREKAVVEGGTEAREGLGKRGRESSG